MLNCFYSLSSYPTISISISITKTLFGLSTHLTENSLSQLLGPIINVYKSTVCPILTIQIRVHKSTIWANYPASNVKACGMGSNHCAVQGEGQKQVSAILRITNLILKLLNNTILNARVIMFLVIA